MCQEVCAPFVQTATPCSSSRSVAASNTIWWRLGLVQVQAPWQSLLRRAAALGGTTPPPRDPTPSPRPLSDHNLTSSPETGHGSITHPRSPNEAPPHRPGWLRARTEVGSLKRCRLPNAPSPQQHLDIMHVPSPCSSSQWQRAARRWRATRTRRRRSWALAGPGAALPWRFRATKEQRLHQRARSQLRPSQVRLSAASGVLL